VRVRVCVCVAVLSVCVCVCVFQQMNDVFGEDRVWKWRSEGRISGCENLTLSYAKSAKSYRMRAHFWIASYHRPDPTFEWKKGY